MKGMIVALDQYQGGAAAARLIDGALDDFLLQPPDGVPVPGTIYRAIADRPLKGSGGMIVRLPEGSAFLRQPGPIAPGERVLVQVTGFAEDGKAVPVTARVLFKSRFVIVTPGNPGINISKSIRDPDERARLHGIIRETLGDPDEGLIIRSSAAGAQAGEIAADAVTTVEKCRSLPGPGRSGDAALLVEGPDPHALARREWAGTGPVDEAPGSFARHGVDDLVDALGSPRVSLPGGASFWVEPTRALIAVDVNTGADQSQAAGLKANIAAAKTLPRQLRCRGLGGQIAIDFAPCPKRNRRQIEQALQTAFRADPVETALVGWTKLGHFELQRKRERMPLKGTKG